MTNPAAIAWYDQHAASVAADYKAQESVVLHGWAVELLPAAFVTPPGWPVAASRCLP